ncbi:MAG: hypothetical protein KDD70_09610 [Bdellovibrionales bacterium]|nr:hypothetical protein [Bdellovibrionales bacterium]
MKASSKKTKKFLLSLLFTALVLPIAAMAESYSLIVPQFPPAGANCISSGYNGLAGVIESMKIIYDAAKQKLTFEVESSTCQATGLNQDGFLLVISSGPDPKQNAGQYGIIYFDGQYVTIYAYNGINGPFSWANGSPGPTIDPSFPLEAAADRILSNHPASNDPQFVHESVAETLPNGNRHFKLVLDTTMANVGFLPQFPDLIEAWEGIAFGEYSVDMTAPKLGIWYHPFAQLVTQYCTSVAPALTTAGGGATGPCSRINQNPNSTTFGKSSDGYLKQWSFGVQGWVDVANVPVNKSPSCNVIAKNAHYNQKRGCYQLRVGESINGEFNFSDPENGEFTVDYTSTLPDSALSPLSPAHFNGTGKVTFNWTADLANQGTTQSIMMTATDGHQASEMCQTEICVKPNTPPTCDIQFATETPNVCEGTETRVEFTGAGSSDPDGDTLNYVFTTSCDGGASISLGAQGITGDLVLTAPGTGQGVSGCEVTLTVSDVFGQTSTCSLPIEVEPCDLDCAGTINGTAVIDQCGICDGDGTSCLDCAGTPNGTAQVDACGICGGDGSSCLDCAGTPNGTAEVDQCNVCNGDGLSCLDCESVEISQFQFVADASLKSAERTARRQLLEVARRAEKKSGTLTKAFQKRVRALALELIKNQEEGWFAIWIPDSNVTSCENAGLAANVCVTVSNLDPLNTYFDRAAKLRELINLSARIAKKSLIRYQTTVKGKSLQEAKRIATKQTKRPKTRALRFLDAGEANAKQVPTENLDCSQN